MSLEKFTPDRRRFLMLGGMAFVTALPLAACQTAGPVGGSARESHEAAAGLGAIREKAGLKPLRPDRGLEDAALRQSTYMARAGVMEHTTRMGRDFVSRMKDVKTGGTAAENIARGRFDVAQVLVVWMNSPPHRRNMLDPRFSRFGLAYVADAGTPAVRYWAMVLAL